MDVRRMAAATLSVFLALQLLAPAALADEKAASGPPLGVLDIKKVKIEILGVYFMKELKGVNASFKQNNDAKYRGMVMTVKVRKPAGEPLTLNAQDLVLHYSYGSSSDIAKCSGLSAFSTANDTDRPMALYAQGLGSQTTGAATTNGSVVYIDLFFQAMEQDTSDLHLLVAQPAGISFKADGWK
jgi:hypothetical protein